MRFERTILVGAGLAVLCTGMNSAADGITKQIAQGFTAPQLYAIAGAIVAALCLCCFLPVRGREAGDDRLIPRTRHPRATALRSALAVLAMVGFFRAFRDLPIFEVMVLVGMMPLMSAALSAPVLGERPRAVSWVALAVGAVGISLLFPGGIESVSLAHLWALMACFTGTASMVLSRWITRSGAETRAQVFYPNLAIAVVMALVLPFVWQPMGLGDLALVVVYAVLLFAGRWTLTVALNRAPAWVVLPVMNLQFVWAALIGIWAFAETPGAQVVAGAVLVVIAGLVLVFGESKRRVAPVARAA